MIAFHLKQLFNLIINCLTSYWWFQVCQPDKYTGTYECVCPGDCDAQFDPVCGSDCASYFNECTLKKETCEKGLTGVTVASRGLCSFSPTGEMYTRQRITVSVQSYEKRQCS